MMMMVMINMPTTLDVLIRHLVLIVWHHIPNIRNDPRNSFVLNPHPHLPPTPVLSNQMPNPNIGNILNKNWDQLPPSIEVITNPSHHPPGHHRAASRICSSSLCPKGICLVLLSVLTVGGRTITGRTI
jgi:hypothetical protein